jgi:hypothetical protein
MKKGAMVFVKPIAVVMLESSCDTKSFLETILNRLQKETANRRDPETEKTNQKETANGRDPETAKTNQISEENKK